MFFLVNFILEYYFGEQQGIDQGLSISSTCTVIQLSGPTFKELLKRNI